MYDALLQRNRSTEFMNLQRSGLINNSMATRVGLGGNPLLGLMSGMASPDSAMARMASPFMGGNPMAAQMQLYAGLAGAGVMGNFGRMSSISVGETEDIMQSLEKKFYRTQSYPEVQKEINAQGKQVLKDIARGPDANKIFEDMGFKGVKVDKEGNFNAKGEELLKNFNIADADNEIAKKLASQTSAKSDQASMLSAELDDVLKKEGGKIDTELRKGLLKKVQSTLQLSAKEMDKFKTESTKGNYYVTGDVDVDAFRKEMDKLKETSPLSALQAKNEAAKKADGAVKGFNYENSRGFKLEDYTSGFVKAADLRMLGDVKGKGIASTMGDFAEASGGALSAARAVFGNKSGSELVAKISNIAGPEADLGNKEGANKVEELLRKVNATARVAGISIKTMLSIIDAGKQLAANHPALHSTSSAAITQLSMKAVGTAASLGSTMSAADYRKAGAAQGIASQEIKTAQEFAAGPVGATIAAAYYGATDEQKKALDKVLDGKAVTGRALDESLREEMAKARGMSVNELSRLATDNPEMLAEAMKDTRTANKVYDSAKPAITAAMMEHLDRVGLSADEMKDLYKSSKGDFSQVDARVRRYLVTDQDKRVWQHAQIGVQEQLEDSVRSIDEKAAYKKFTEIRDQSAKDEAEMDKKYGSKYAPMVTQVLDALSTGTTSKDITGALTNIFATGNQNTEKANAALSSAAAAGEKISKVVGMKGLKDETKIKTGGLTEAINEFIQKRKDVGAETGDTASTAGLGTLSKEELMTAAKMGGQMGLKDSESAQAELDKLEKEASTNKQWNSKEFSGSRDRLTTLRAWKKTGILDDTQSIKLAQRGGADSLSAATIQAAAGANYKKAFESEKAELTDSMGKQLNALVGTGDQNTWDAQYLTNYYTDKSGKVDQAKMLKDKSKGEGAFDKEAFGDYWDNREASNILNRTQDNINKAVERSGVLGETSPDVKAKTDLGEVINNLIKVLDSGGTIGTGLEQLISAINNI
jgi:hypothetical protein